MKKYAAGGKCGAMSSSFETKDGVKEVNAKLSAALAERAKQDALFSCTASALAKPQAQSQQAIVALPAQKPVPAANQKYSDIDLILSGDFQED
jgi:hypothetical protein